MMRKLEIDAVLRDTFEIVQRDLPLTLSVGAIFFFLPSFIIFGWFPKIIAVDPKIESFADFADVMMTTVALPMVGIGTFGSLGALFVTRLWFQPAGATVGAALRYGIAAVPVAVALHIAVSVGTLIGFILLFVPGVILATRMALVMALIADQEYVSPVAAARDAWEMTAGNGARILLLLILIALLYSLVSFVLTGVDMAFTGTETTASPLLTGFTNGVSGLVAGMLNAALVAAIYRQLRLPDLRGTFS
jgi:uncharacterized membrane protein